MEHLLLKASTTAATDQGTFEAVISTASVDREGDIVEPKALVTALQKWVAAGKRVPLAWAHTENVVGHVDPATAKVAGKQVVASGWIDQSTELGKDAWRLVKSGTLSFSYGFLVPEGGAKKMPGGGGGHHITALDLFEISVVPIAPANNETRVLSFKSLETPPHEELRVLASEVEAGGLADPEQMARLLRDTADTIEKKLTQHTTKQAEPDKETPKSRSADPLKESAMQAALEVLTGATPPLVTKETPKRVPVEDPDELRKRSRDLMLTVLTGNEVTK